MFSKKIVFLSLISVGVFLFADQIMAAVISQYTPLVSIPGVGAPKNLSQYLVGLYNFLLSIVGIVAVLMFIVGGFKYFTAAGNPSAASDAKDTIYNAAYGLILALMSWVIVSTINPDVLVIKRPGSKSLGTYNPVCTTSDTTVGPPANCNCIDGTTTPATAVGNCDKDCRDAEKCTKQIVSCIFLGSSNNPDTNGYCDCLDSLRLKGPAPCNTTCNVKDALTNRHHCTQTDVSYSKDNINFIDFDHVKINDLVVSTGDVYYFKVKLTDSNKVISAPKYFIATIVSNLTSVSPVGTAPPSCALGGPTICSVQTGTDTDTVTIKVQFGVAQDWKLNEFYVSTDSTPGFGIPGTVRSETIQVWVKII